MDVEGDRAVRRRSRARNLAAVVAVQNLLVVACLLTTVYLYLESPTLPEDNVYIQFNVLSGPKTNMFLEFESIRGQHKLQNDKGKVSISCTGPYVWHMQTCFEDIDRGHVSGNLTLEVNNTPVSSVTMNATKNMVCRGLHSIVYLGAGDVARFHLFSQSPKGFRMVNVSMGLNYLLGNNCEY
ncbi:uncharacterized protein V3H82_008866 [Fundulus diaphanus]